MKLFLGWMLIASCGAWCIYNNDELVRLERGVFNAVKSLFIKEAPVVVRGETEAERQARFNTGAEAGNELYKED